MKKTERSASPGGLAFICGLLLMCVGFVFAISVASEFAPNRFVAFLDIPTLFFIKILLVGQVIAVSGIKPLVSGLNAVFAKRYYLTEEQRAASIALFKMLSRASIRAGFICFLVGLLQMLHFLSDPSALGPYTAMVLLALLYGFILSFFVFDPMAQVLEKRADRVTAAITTSPAVDAALNDREVVQVLTRLCRQNGISLEDLIQAEKISIDK